MKSYSLGFATFSILILILIPVYIWLPYANLTTIQSVFLSLGQFCALVGYVFYLTNFILSGRYKIFDKLFSGLNRMYISHHLFGVSAFVLLLLHPLFITLSYLSISLSAAFDFLIPSIVNLPVLFGMVALSVTIVLLYITLYVKIEYDRWKLTHKFLGLGLFFSGLHMLFIGSTLAVSLPLRSYYYVLATLAAVSYVRNSLLGRYFVKKTKFVVTDIKIVEEKYLKIQLSNISGHPFDYHPGQFVFTQFLRQGVSNESHPFSITTTTNDKFLGLGIKVLGGHTETLKLVKRDDEVMVEGPYGKFAWAYFDKPTQIWVAGGIGVTPFLSMAKGVVSSKVILYYCVLDKKDAVFFDDLREIVRKNPNIELVLWESENLGKITADAIEKRSAGDFEYYICGPTAMMKALKSQLKRKGISDVKIHTEEFALS